MKKRFWHRYKIEMGAQAAGLAAPTSSSSQRAVRSLEPVDDAMRALHEEATEPELFFWAGRLGRENISLGAREVVLFGFLKIAYMLSSQAERGAGCVSPWFFGG